MPGPTNHQTPPPTNSPSSSPGPIAQQLVQLQGAGQTPPNLPQPTTIPGKAPSKKKGKPWKEVREWLNIIGVLLIPLLIGVYAIVNNAQQTALQLDQQRETALKTYEDDISSLLLDRHLATSRSGDEVRTVALAKTLEVFHQLDGPRNVRAIQFLQDAQLIGTDFTAKTPNTHNIIDFSGADLTNADLSYADLSYADLSYADLDGANLSYANLNGADLSYADLDGVDLSYASLFGVDLSYANLYEANLSHIDRIGIAEIGTGQKGFNLSYADAIDANLSYTNLSGVILTKADLSGATMPNGTRHSCQEGEEIYCP
jgi:uncharacterized protein YjbI with pentapeptide repeats